MRKILLLAVLLVSTFISQSQNVSEKDKSIAEKLVRDNKDAIGLSADQVSNLIVHTSYQIPGTDMRIAYMQQTYQGLPVINKLLTLVFKNGKVVSNTGDILISM